MNQKGFSLIFIILGLILVIGIASGAYYLGILKNLKPQNPQDTNQTSQPNPSPSDEIANWKTYTNEVNKYTLQYPSNIFIRLVCPGEELTLIKRKENDYRELVQMDTCARGGRYDLEVDRWGSTREEPKDSKYHNVTKEEIVVAGVKARKYISKATQTEGVGGISIPQWYTQVLIDHNGSTYEIYLGDRNLEDIFNQILSTFKFTDQKSTKITDDSSAKDLVLNFYKAFEKEDGSTLFSYMTPPVTPQEKGEYSYLTGADLDPNAFYRAFLRVKLARPSIKSVQRVDDKTFEVTATDELQNYSQVTTQWSQPTLRNVKFTVTKTTASWFIDKFTYTGAINWTYKGTEKYNGFPNLDSN